MQELENFAVDHSLVIEVTEPQPDEIPPTLLQNEALLSSGQDLVSFYMTPSYWLWDPSAIVFFSFALFFGIILGDAGYGVLFAVVLALTWKPMGRSQLGRRLRILFAGLAASTIICGILLGNYFGIVLSKSSLLSRLQVLDLDNYSAMMRLTILIGCAHLILANTAYAWHRRRSVAALASIGWLFYLFGAISVWLGSSGWSAFSHDAGRIHSYGVGSMRRALLRRDGRRLRKASSWGLSWTHPSFSSLW